MARAGMEAKKMAAEKHWHYMYYLSFGLGTESE